MVFITLKRDFFLFDFFTPETGIILFLESVNTVLWARHSLLEDVVRQEEVGGEEMGKRKNIIYT